MTTDLVKSAAEQPTDSLTKQSRKARLRKGLFTGAAVALSTIAVVSAAPLAQAWPWSPDVSLVGIATCKTVPNALDTAAISTRVDVHETREFAEQSANWIGYWEAHLTTIPREGSWASVWIYCAVPGNEPAWRFAGNVFVEPPPVDGTESSAPFVWIRA
jgi:hypothetical protein